MRERDYAEWFSWAKRNVSGSPEMCHVAALAALQASERGLAKPDAGLEGRRAAQFRGPAWSRRASERERAYAEWYDWARRQTRANGETLHRATEAALGVMEQGGDSRAAAARAREILATD